MKIVELFLGFVSFSLKRYYNNKLSRKLENRCFGGCEILQKLKKSLQKMEGAIKQLGSTRGRLLWWIPILYRADQRASARKRRPSGRNSSVRKFEKKFFVFVWIHFLPESNFFLPYPMEKWANTKMTNISRFCLFLTFIRFSYDKCTLKLSLKRIIWKLFWLYIFGGLLLFTLSRDK